MDQLCVQLRQLGSEIDPDKLDRFADGVEALGGLNQALHELSSDHDHWQKFDDELRRIESVLDQEVEELEFSWPIVTSKGEKLYTNCREAWATDLVAEQDEVELALKDQDPTDMRVSFRGYYRLVVERFYQVDVALKELLCVKLVEVTEPLAVVLEVIQS
jgi:hypothetical protein